MSLKANDKDWNHGFHWITRIPFLGIRQMTKNKNERLRSQIAQIFKKGLLSFYPKSGKPKSDIRKGSLSMKKSNPFQHTLTRVFHISLNSRSGRRGRMRRHMRDNMASRANRPGNLFPEGGRCQISLPRICPSQSSPGVFTNPPAKPTGMFFRPNRQWCGARRGGGEGSPRARVSFEQQERVCFKPLAIFSSIADRQQQGRSSGHGRAVSSMARTRASRLRDMLDMRKRHDFHIREAQQNMGTGNAALSRCLYPFLRPLEFYDRPISPLYKTVRAGVAY